MALYTTDQKVFIVDLLGKCYSPRSIADAFRARWSDTACDEQAVVAFDPTKGAILPPDVYAAWLEAREFAKENWRSEATTADKGIRVLYLHREFVERRSRNVFDAELLEQIADEMKGDEGGGDLSGVPTEFERVIVDPQEHVDSGKTETSDRDAASVSPAPR